MKEPQTNAEVPSLTLGQDKEGASVSAVCESLWLKMQKGFNRIEKGAEA